MAKILSAGIALSAMLVLSCASDSATTDPIDASKLEAMHRECVKIVNTKRADAGIAELSRWTADESCSDSQAATDMTEAGAHGSYGSCGEAAQNTCPGWPTDTSTAAHLETLRSCLQMMWDEGPGTDFSEHGHYLNMSDTDFTKLACGFAEVDGKLWVNMNFK